MTFRIGPTVPPVTTSSPTPTAATPSATSNTSNAAGPSGSGEPELRIYAPRRPFREVMRETRGETTVRPTAPTPRSTAPTPSTDPGVRPPVVEPVREAAVDLLRDVARGERFVRSVMRRAARGADFSPQELLAIQAGVYRYTQELELVSKIVDKGTAAVRQTLQSQS